MSIQGVPHTLVSNPDSSRPKVAILTNILAPVRMPIFKRLAENFNVTVVWTGEETNREQWRGLERQADGFRVKRAQGWILKWTRRDGKTVLDTRYLHVNPGVLIDLLSIRPAAIITAEIGFRSLVALVYGWLFRRPVWVWWGGTLHTERGIGAIRRILRRTLAPRVRRWFSYGSTSTEYLRSLGVEQERIVELQNCIPEADYQRPVTPAFKLQPRPVLLCVGRLVPGKGVDLLLQTAACLQSEGKVFSLLVVGDGPERQFLEQTSTELGLKNVHFQSACLPNEMPAVYRSGDVLVFPTLDDVWGLVVNEALWSGLPALVSIYAGCAKELVPLENTFDPLNRADFADKLRSAIAAELSPPDLNRLKTMAEVGDTIVQDLQRILRTKE